MDFNIYAVLGLRSFNDLPSFCALLNAHNNLVKGITFLSCKTVFYCDHISFVVILSEVIISEDSDLIKCYSLLATKPCLSSLSRSLMPFKFGLFLFLFSCTYNDLDQTTYHPTWPLLLILCAFFMSFFHDSFSSLIYYFPCWTWTIFLRQFNYHLLQMPYSKNNFSLLRISPVLYYFLFYDIDLVVQQLLLLVYHLSPPANVKHC